MACVDIYQALTENRPYKAGMSHEKACSILLDMAEKGWLDRAIVETGERLLCLNNEIGESCEAVRELPLHSFFLFASENFL